MTTLQHKSIDQVMKNPACSKNYPQGPHLPWGTVVQPQATLHSLLVRVWIQQLPLPQKPTYSNSSFEKLRE